MFFRTNLADKEENFYFDPIDGNFVRIFFGDIDDVSMAQECSGSLNEQGRKDSYKLIITMTLLAFFLLFLLYAACYYSYK